MLQGTLALFKQDRDSGGNETVNRPLLQSLIKMITTLGLYTSLFEPAFVEDSHQYYAHIASRDSSSTPFSQYVMKCSNLMNIEGARCEDYRLEQSTKRLMIGILEEELVGKFIPVFTDITSVQGLLENTATEDSNIPLQVLYDLLNKVGNAGELLKPAWETFITTSGTRIVSDKEHEVEMVPRLLDFKGMLDKVWSDPFCKNEILGHSLRESFTRFINARRSGESDSNNSKPAEMIAKYVDQVLRSGTKGLPPLKYETANHPSQDDDAAIAQRLELVVDLFRFISGKDVFEAFYKKDLARRLLMSRSASVDAERLMLTKLKTG